MKLISAVEISRFLENEVCFDIACHECDERLKAVCHFVNQRPADYDIDKVVEQLEKYKELECDDIDDDIDEEVEDAEELYDIGRSQGRLEAYLNAIEIVKGGAE